MIIMHIMGGLGNQMFEYSLYLKLLSLGKDVKLDIDSYQVYRQHNGFEISKIFTTKPKIMKPEDIEKFIVNYGVMINGRIIKGFTPEKQILSCDESIYELDNCYLYGYWASHNYFKDIEDTIRQEFTFKNQLDERNSRILGEIDNSNSVSLHIRRGDYLAPGNTELFVCLGNTNYYQEAIKIIEDRVMKPKFFIFSNDMEWVKSNFKINAEVVYVDSNEGEDSYKDMLLMSSCKHNIVANSSFSWWGAWLNKNKDKIVTIPKKWVNMTGIDDDKMEVFPENWIKL